MLLTQLSKGVTEDECVVVSDRRQIFFQIDFLNGPRYFCAGYPMSRLDALFQMQDKHRFDGGQFFMDQRNRFRVLSLHPEFLLDDDERPEELPCRIIIECFLGCRCHKILQKYQGGVPCHGFSVQ